MLTGITLTVESGLQIGTKFHINVPGFCTIGRSSDCDVAVIGHPESATVSRRHCRLDVTAFGAKLRDLGSRNGTFLNGNLIGKRQHPVTGDFDISVSDGYSIVDSDVISLGGVTLHVALETEQSGFISPTYERAMIAEMVSMGAE